MKNITKILITILSLILLFSVSCNNENKTGGGVSPTSPADGGGDRPTGSTPVTADELVNSIPDTTGSPTSDFNGTTTYTGTLNFDDAGFDFTGDSSEDEIKAGFPTMKEVIFIITDNKLTLQEKSTSSGVNSGTPSIPTTLFENATLYKDGEKYNAKAEKDNSNKDLTVKNVYHIEFFKSADGNNLTSVKYINANSLKGSIVDESEQTININYSTIATYTGNLTKQ